jgi:ABC-type dipeptide/oligopeptide/nickel transport system permease component
MASVRLLTRQPHWYWIPVRVLLVTFLLTLLSFAVSLLLGILGTLISAALRGTHPDVTIAYKYVALPAAVFAAAIVLVSALVIEIRRYRQAKALAEIERAS